MLGRHLLQGGKGIPDDDETGVREGLRRHLLDDEGPHAGGIQVADVAVTIVPLPAQGEEQRPFGREQRTAVDQQLLDRQTAVACQAPVHDTGQIR